MALIQCPECGAQISSGADHCVHCGCQFTYCPECGAVYVGKPEQCANCGYAFKRDRGQKKFAADTGGEQPISENQTNYEETWKAAAPFRYKIQTIDEWLGIALLVIGLICLLIAFFVITNWQGNSDPLESLAQTGDTFKTVRTLVIIMCIALAYDLASGMLSKTCAAILLSNWLIDKHIAPEDGVQQYYGKIENIKMLSDETMKDAAYIKAHPSEKTGFYVLFFILLIAVAGFAISLGIAAIENLEFYMMQTVLFDVPFELQVSAALIAAGASLALYLIVRIFAYRGWNKKVEAWVDKVAPGVNKRIEKKIDEAVKKMFGKK